VINQALLKIHTDNEVVDSDFFYHYFDWDRFQRRIVDNTHGGAMQNLVGMELFRSVELVRPPLLEQRAIATALSDVDALLNALGGLIAKKRDLKQAAMQQLLTGQTRLPGFHGEWDQVRLGDLFSFKNGLNKAKEFFGYGTPIVNYMDVFAGSVIRSSNLEGRVSLTRSEVKNFDVQKGDVFFTRTSETTEEIGIASVMFDEPTDTVFSGFVLRARPLEERLNDGFKAYCFGSASVRKQIISKASYTTRALTNGRILSEVLLPLPSLAEQTAIAAVLSDMDAELSALEARRGKTRDLKQAMMQELLTGKTRLV
jgi:type I restriction enzyme S subunit